MSGEGGLFPKFRVLSRYLRDLIHSESIPIFLGFPVNFQRFGRQILLAESYQTQQALSTEVTAISKINIATGVSTTKGASRFKANTKSRILELLLICFNGVRYKNFPQNGDIYISTYR